MTEAEFRALMGRAWVMGQNYWADADSESYAANRRSDQTRQRYEQMVEEAVKRLNEQEGAANDRP